MQISPFFIFTHLQHKKVRVSTRTFCIELFVIHFRERSPKQQVCQSSNHRANRRVCYLLGNKLPSLNNYKMRGYQWTLRFWELLYLLNLYKRQMYRSQLLSDFREELCLLKICIRKMHRHQWT